MDKINLYLHRDYLTLFGFLKDNPTRLERKGDFYRLTYFLPLGRLLTPFRFGKIWLTVNEGTPSEGWELVRDFSIAYADGLLIAELLDFENEELSRQRQGTGLPLIGWVFDCICYGIASREDTSLFIRAMFLAGYDFEQVTALFSAIAKKKDLAGFFLQEMNRLYKGVEV